MIVSNMILIAPINKKPRAIPFLYKKKLTNLSLSTNAK